MYITSSGCNKIFPAQQDTDSIGTIHYLASSSTVAEYALCIINNGNISLWVWVIMSFSVANVQRKWYFMKIM